jgi:hypothetical protein
MMANPSNSTKAQLLSEINKAWGALNSYLARITELQMTTIHDGHGWTVKDHLTHLAAWEDSVVFFLQGKPRYEALGVQETLFASGSFDEMNAVIQQLRKSLSLAEATAQLRSTHAYLISLLQAMTDADLNRPLRHYLPSSPAGDRRHAIELIRDNTVDHFSEHLAWMETLVSAPG